MPAALRDLCSYNGTALPSNRFKASSYDISLLLTQDHLSAETPLNTVNATTAVTFLALQDTACVVLNIDNLTVSQVNVTITVPANGTNGTTTTTTACLCGLQPGCLADNCVGVVVPTTPGGSTAVVDMQPYYAMANTSVQLSMAYTAAIAPADMSHGLWRSLTYAVYDGSCDTNGQDFAHFGFCAVNSTRDPDDPDWTPAALYKATLLSTSFAPHYARNFFPCFDDPAYQALFKLTVDAPSNALVLSNVAPSSTTPSSTVNNTVLSFVNTRPMSPHQLSLVAARALNSSSGQVTSSSGSPVNITLYTVPVNPWNFFQAPNVTSSQATAALLKRTLGYATSAYNFYVSYTGIAPNITKIDLVGLIGITYTLGAPGISIMDYERLTYNELWQGVYGQFRSADVICHEIAHQWFGGLITSASWSDSLVTEGLTTWLEYKCLSAVAPQMPGSALMRHYVAPFMQPLPAHVAPQMQEEFFDDVPFVPSLASASITAGRIDQLVTSCKGAALLASLESMLEASQPGKMQAAVQTFLQRSQAAGLATNNDLLSIIATQLTQQAPFTNTSVSDLLSGINTWVSLPGHPVLTASSADDVSLTPPPAPPPSPPPSPPAPAAEPTPPAPPPPQPPPLLPPPPGPDTNNTSNTTASPPPPDTPLPMPAPANVTPPANSTRKARRSLLSRGFLLHREQQHTRSLHAHHTELQLQPSRSLKQQRHHHQAAGRRQQHRQLHQAVGRQLLQQAPASSPVSLSQAPSCGFLLNTTMTATPATPLVCPSVNGSWWIPYPVGVLSSSTSSYLSSPGAAAQWSLLAGGTGNASMGQVPSSSLWMLQAKGNAELYRTSYSAARTNALLATIQKLNLGVAMKANNTSDAAMWSWRESVLLDSNSILSDVLARQLAPSTTNQPADMLLPAIEAAVSSPEAKTGYGSLLLAMPALQALEELTLRFGSNIQYGNGTNCSTTLNAYKQRLLRPNIASLITQYNALHNVNYTYRIPANITIDPSIPSGYDITAQDLFLYNTTKSRVLISALTADPLAANFACQLSAYFFTPDNITSNDSWCPHMGPDMEDADITKLLEVDWRPVAMAAAMMQPSGCNLATCAQIDLGELQPISADNLLRMLREVVAFSATLQDPSTDAPIERWMYALSYTTNPDTRASLMSGIMAGAKNDTTNEDYILTLSVQRAVDLLKNMARGAQQSPSGRNDVLDYITSDAGWSNAVDSLGTHGALMAVEEVMVVSVNSPDRLAQLDALLAKGASALGLQDMPAASRKYSSISDARFSMVRQWILSKAQSTVQWVATNSGPLCSALETRLA